MTRSVIANLESGRKDDLMVSQLLAIAQALDVYPVALMVDLFEPDASPDLPSPGQRLERYRWEDVLPGQPVENEAIDAEATNYSASRWIAGMGASGRQAPDSHKLARRVLRALDQHHRAMELWEATAARLQRTRTERDNDSSFDLEGQDGSLLMHLELSITGAAEAVVAATEVLEELGIPSVHRLDHVARVMSLLGEDMPQLGQRVPRNG